MYSDTGRRSIPPEKLIAGIAAADLMYSIRSERMHVCSSWTTTCCFAGLLVCRWMIQRVGSLDFFQEPGPLTGVGDCARNLFDAILAQAEARVR